MSKRSYYTDSSNSVSRSGLNDTPVDDGDWVAYIFVCFLMRVLGNFSMFGLDVWSPFLSSELFFSTLRSVLVMNVSALVYLPICRFPIITDCQFFFCLSTCIVRTRYLLCQGSVKDPDVTSRG